MIRRRFASWKGEFNPDKYLTIEALEDGLSVTSMIPVYYRTSEGGWVGLPQNTATPQIKMGECLYLKAQWGVRQDYGEVFKITKKCKLKGNCMSLLFLDTADKNNDLSSYPYAFYRLFEHNDTIVEVSPDFLPATTLANNCYNAMFKYCTSLTTAPTLPATTLANNCYNAMFEYCTSLTTAPTLPATTLANNCYDAMFEGCSSLTTAPALPATTLANYCYSYMFYGCSKLNYIKALFTTTPSSTYTNNWVRGVASSGTFVKNKNATWSVIGENGVPSGWTIQKV